ncbi:hypothetical protein C0J56_16145 [Pseudomonas fluorescens]|nr:hypothetical protein C0J56_16145 [Pseudomonas fluorescens]
MGASLLAIALKQPTLTLADTPQSRAGSLPPVLWRIAIAPDAPRKILNPVKFLKGLFHRGPSRLG